MEREPYAATSISFPDEQSALGIDIESSPRYKSLDGEWDFKFLESWTGTTAPSFGGLPERIGTYPGSLDPGSARVRRAGL